MNGITCYRCQKPVDSRGRCGCKATILHAHVLDGLRALPAGMVQCCVTSPPYWGLRSYGTDDVDWPEVRFSPMPGLPPIVIPAGLASFGLEKTPEEFIGHAVEVFREVRRVLRDDGTLWLNLGDSYAGSGRGGYTGMTQSRRRDRVPVPRSDVSVNGLKPKDLVGVPWRVAFALQADGWFLRSAMPWVKRSAMPESCTDRPTSALEYVFLLSKRPRYYFDMESVRREPSGITGGACFGGPLKDAKEQAKVGSSKRTQHRAATKEDRQRYASTGRAFRNGDLWFASITEPHGMVGVGDEIVGLDVNPAAFKSSHFATFPPKLIEPCILAGTGNEGCCPECGAAWERATDVIYDNPGNRTTNGPRSLEQRHETAGFAVRLEKRTATTGWQPSCNCGISDTVPCVVLDPFHGAGTTGMVAQQNGRRYIGIELNAEYIDLSLPRLTQPALF